MKLRNVHTISYLFPIGVMGVWTTNGAMARGIGVGQSGLNEDHFQTDFLCFVDEFQIL